MSIKQRLAAAQAALERKNPRQLILLQDEHIQGIYHDICSKGETYSAADLERLGIDHDLIVIVCERASS